MRSSPGKVLIGVDVHNYQPELIFSDQSTFQVERDAHL
jgi:hypothetical protein